jgi:hypothetical protein
MHFFRCREDVTNTQVWSLSVYILHWDINRVPSAQPALFALPQVARLITRLARNNLKRMREECARAFVAFGRTNIWCERARTEKYTKSGLRTFISTDAVAHKNSVIGCMRLKWRRIKRREREKEKMKDLREVTQLDKIGVYS